MKNFIVGSRGLLLAAGLTFLLMTTPAAATTVYVMSVGYSDVQVMINGATIRKIQVGETTPEGIRLDSVESGAAILQVDKRLVRLSIGQSISSEIAIRMSPDGQFRLTVYVNNTPLRAIIDTGASAVAISSNTARQLGIDYLRGRPSISHTANGSIRAYLVNIPRIQLGEILALNVVGIVSEGQTISHGTDVLLGNSFLRYVQMQRSGDVMTLTRAAGP